MYEDDEYVSVWSVIAWIVGLGALAFLMFSCVQSDKAHQAKVAALPVQEQAIERHHVELYFEIDGCKVYKFDGANGYTSHFATCPGNITSTNKSGKSTIPSDIQTVVP